MSVISDFDRHSCRYKQFKVRNTRTSSPQSLVRTKHIRKNIYCDSKPSFPVLSPTKSEVDCTYVSYVQWRHYLVVPNSARKFKVRFSANEIVSFRDSSDTIISGNINMLPDEKKGTSKTKVPKPQKQEMLNSRIEFEIDMANRRESLDRRNRRVADAIMPIIKKSLKRIFGGESTLNHNGPIKSKSARILSNFASHLNMRKQYDVDREYLISCREFEE